ncbi:tetratricopeptide repeat protein [Sinosporangium siamense]|uniref:Tetratricopeptide repeat protein n=1 Tax=Sinosporangium siamense TaxID=1367973 RepID=A0A919V8C3_9ACTN|nr:tetratricopeptide repeat protein [Sinosporangium siamense]GII96000.1 hypothetical protein Ssi02_62310 [Sinosporangium siamense]
MAHAHEGVDDPRLEAEGEVSMALLALDSGDLAHAAQHVADALLHEPTLPEAHELLALLASHPDGGLELFALEERTFLGTVVARAHVLASLGRHSDALDLLVQAQRHEPAARFAHVPWVLDAELATKIAPDHLCLAISGLLPALADPVREEGRPALMPYMALMREAAAAHPDSATVLWVASLLARRVGEPKEAVELALRSERMRPSFEASLALGYAYRNLGEWDSAERAMVQALTHQPDNYALFTDIAELLELSGRHEDALAWVERALAVEPEHESAFPTACSLRYGMDQDLRHLVALADYLRRNPGNRHAGDVLAMCSRRSFWLGPLPAPGEALTALMFRVVEQGVDTATWTDTVSLSVLEPPSALLAVRRALPRLEVEVDAVLDPDPRLTVPEVYFHGPVKNVTRRVWSYTGNVAHPMAGPPAPDVSDAVARLAEQRWPHLPAAYNHAAALADAGLADLLGVLVHPPESPYVEPVGWPTWIRAVQAWACLGIAHLRPEEPWESSTRREVLVDLAFGPEDWISEAALFALVATAWVRPEVRAEVAGLVGWRFMAAFDAAGSRPVTILPNLALLVRVTPDVVPDVLNLASVVLSEEDGDDEKDGDDAGDEGEAGEGRG